MQTLTTILSSPWFLAGWAALMVPSLAILIRPDAEPHWPHFGRIATERILDGRRSSRRVYRDEEYVLIE